SGSSASQDRGNLFDAGPGTMTPGLIPGGGESVTRSVEPAVDVAALYAVHRLGLVRLALLLVDDVGSAEDVVHDAFIALHQHRDRLREPKAAIEIGRASCRERV